MRQSGETKRAEPRRKEGQVRTNQGGANSHSGGKKHRKCKVTQGRNCKAGQEVQTLITNTGSNKLGNRNTRRRNITN